MEAHTYLTIDTETVCGKAETILNAMGVDYQLAYSKRFGSSIHQVVYDLKSLYIDSAEDKGLMPRIMFVNSYRKESAFVIGVGFLRGICTNGLVFGKSFYNEKIVHRVGPTADMKLQQLEPQMIRALDVVCEIPDAIDEMKNIAFSEEAWIHVVGNLDVPRKVKDVAIYNKVRERLRPEDSANNAWTLYKVVNETMRKVSSPLQYTKANNGLMDDVIALAKAA